MFSSAKFLSPIVTAGLPVPGPLDAGATPDVVALELLEDVELLLPHAASPTVSAAVANSAAALNQRVLDLLHRVFDIRRLLVCVLC
jgi:hypothetical protein